MAIGIIIKLFIIALHTAIILYLIFKLRDIELRPRVYNSAKNFERYKNSQWHWPEKSPYPKNSPPENSGRFVIYYCFLLGILIFVPPVLYEQGDILRNTYIDCFYSNLMIPAHLVGLAFIIALSFVLPIFSSLPVCICYNIFHLFPRRPWWKKWKYSVTIMLVACCIAFPVRAAAHFSYGHADENKLVYSPPWTLAEQTFEYDKITRTEIIPGAEVDDPGHYYIYNEKGQRFDLYNGTSISDEAVAYIISRLPDVD